MKIFTSYFAKGKTLKAHNVKMISISLYPPPNVKCAAIPDLAPTKSILFDKYMTEERYTHRFLSEVLSKLDARSIIDQIATISKGSDAALCCYETPDNFCHRHIVARWLTENTGIEIHEFGKTNAKQTALF